jgi:hypothetical protein
MTEPVTVLQHVEVALRRACSFDHNDRVPPAALLWADKEAVWRPVVARLGASLPVVTLGDYDGERTGPAIWLRCVVDRTVGDVPEDEVPIVYVPGYDRGDLRAIEECPTELQPIAELQYRGAFFGSRAGRDWTTTAFFSNREEGLGIEIGRDADTDAAFARALPVLLDEPVALMRQKAPLRAADLGALLDPDPVKTLLRWLDDPTNLEGLDAAAREEFIRVARDDYGFSPTDDGPIVAAERLGGRVGAWKTVWDRFAENPSRYLGVVERLRQARPVEVLVVDDLGSWPQDNEDGERALRSALSALADRPADEVRAAVMRFENEHGKRRAWVWATLGQAPLAGALRHLAELARGTESQLGGETPAEIAEAYANGGWRIDDFMLLAIAAVEAKSDRDAVEGAVAALYRPWADTCARRFQESALAHGTSEFGSEPPTPTAGECVLFTDGLRFDLGARLARRIQGHGIEAELAWQLTALPSLTATAKPAVSPAAARLAGDEGFGTVVAATRQTVTADVLRKAITAEGITVVADGTLADPAASGWAEFGNVDEIGHSHADRFPHVVDAQVSDIADRVLLLLESGWSSVRVVTDHGWLYVPGGLEKANLPEHLTVTRKGRAARLRDDAGTVEHPVVPWRWDSEVRVAVAPGLSCYVAGRVYEHGGLSPQECVTPVLTVRKPGAAGAASIGDVTWTGMRVRVAVDGASPGSSVDVRTKAASATTSKLDVPVSISDGTASPLIVDPDATGEAAFVVVLAADGSLLAQRSTTIGGEA